MRLIIFLPALLLLFSLAIPQSNEAAQCAHAFGCWYGYCWVKCNDGTLDNATYLDTDYSSGDPWCYTKRSRPKMEERARCNTAKQCSGCWDCILACNSTEFE